MNRTRRTLCRVYCVCVEGVGGGEDRRVFLPVRGRYKELHMMVWTFKSIDELLQCDHSNESYWAVLCCGAASMVYKEVTNFWVCGWNPKVWPFKWKYLSGTFQWRPQSQSEQYFHMILSPPSPTLERLSNLMCPWYSHHDSFEQWGWLVQRMELM